MTHMSYEQALLAVQIEAVKVYTKKITKAVKKVVNTNPTDYIDQLVDVLTSGNKNAIAKERP